MPLVRFIRGIVYRGEGVEVGTVLEVSDRDAHILCEGYKDAERVEGEAPVLSGMTVRDQIQTRDPVAEHRDPAIKPSGRKRG